MPQDPEQQRPEPPTAEERELSYVKVDELRPEGAADDCLRPLGLCELGGACDLCWYGAGHRRRA
jgi:hypothetical protein